MLRVTNVFSHVSWIVLLLTSCTDGDSAHRTPVDDYLLPQATGVHLGMTFSELAVARPRVRDDSGTVVETTAHGDNVYLFRNRRLSAIRMYPPPDLSDAEIDARVGSIRDHWTARAGVPPDSSVRIVAAKGAFPEHSYQVYTWRVGDVDLVLSVETVNPQPRIRSRSQLAIIQAAELAD